MAYADDVVVIGGTHTALSNVVIHIESATSVGLEIDSDKTKYMVLADNAQPGNEIEIDSKKYGKVQNFKYLGSIISETNDIEKDIREKIASGNRSLCAL